MSTVKLHYKNIAATASTYIGEPGSIFFDPATSQLRVGDGVTPGGNAVTLDIGLATHDDATYINNLLYQQQGTGFATNTDSLKQLSVRLTTVASGTTLAAVQSALSTPLSSLATSASLATAQTSLNTINTNTVGLAQATNLATLQSTANNISANTNAITGVGFVPGTDDLHAVRQAITAMQADITAIKTKVGA